MSLDKTFVIIQSLSGTVYYPVQGGDKAVVTFESVDEILKCDHSHETC